MPDLYSLVSVPKKSSNAGRPSGKKSFIVIFRWDDVATYKRDEKQVKVAAFAMKAGKKPIAVYATNSSINPYHTSEGDADAKGFIQHVDFEIPGTDLEVEEFFENNVNENLGAIVLNCDAAANALCKIAGTPCQPLQITVNSQDNNEANKNTVQMASILRGPALGRIAKSLIPVTDNADINSILGLGVGSDGTGI
jgi:hypothetical protein